MKKVLLTAIIIVNAVTGYCQQAIPEFKNKVMVRTSGNTLEALEPTGMRYDIKGRIGKGTTYITAEGPKASVDHKPSSGNVFVVKIEPGVDPEGVITLYKFSTDKKSRKIETGSVGMGGMKNAKLPTTQLNFRKVQDGVYEILPAKTLEPGEYIFTVSQELISGTMVAGEIKGFAFSVPE